MAHILPPFRADHVGSFLRTDAVASARAMFHKGLISRDDLTKIEDEEIAKLVAKEKECGLKAVTDGEFRRAFWHLDFLVALDGVDNVAAKAWSTRFQGTQPKATTAVITGKVGFPKDHPFLEAFRRIKRIAGDTMVKFTIPSPSMLYQICIVRTKDYQPIEMYKDHDDLLLADIEKTWTDAMLALYNEGCRYLQFDDTSWGEFCSDEKTKLYSSYGRDLKKIQENYVKVLNGILSHKPADMTITMHICRGNFRSTWFSSGGYEPVAELLFGHCNVDGFFLEYDSDRAGDFKPLRFIKDQTVVLGLITSKFPELEDEEVVKGRIKEASQYVPLDRLCLSTQCGFSSTEEGNKLTQEQQWAKLKLVVKIAKEVWKDA
jgi:5-methyltetrahydropteroyltriglutamate--homocysteine methyltransferase